MKKISLLGSTGSIGTQTLDVIKSHPEEFSLAAMTAGKNITLAAEQIALFKPSLVSVERKEDAERLQKEFPDIRVLFGRDGLIEAASYKEADFLMNAVMGSVGLEPTLAAIEAGKDIGIANKETLVTAGHIVTQAAKKHEALLLPVDSEHSAIYQCLLGNRREDVDRLIITASGGSFRDLNRDQLQNVTKEDALNHPNWSMGAKITIDSATMMNKGFEVIEAHWLFDMAYEDIEVVIHRESIVHSLVEYKDKSVIAHLGSPDMRVPIQFALSQPKRLELKDTNRLNLWEAGALHFSKPDFDRYRCLQYAYDAGKTGGTMTAVLNAANEIAVAEFLAGRISFVAIEEYIEKAMHRHSSQRAPDLQTILEVDKETRKYVASLIG